MAQSLELAVFLIISVVFIIVLSITITMHVMKKQYENQKSRSFVDSSEDTRSMNELFNQSELRYLNEPLLI